MAIWQFLLKAFPDRTLQKHYGAVPSIMRLEKAEELDWSDDYNLPDHILSDLVEILPAVPSWSARATSLFNDPSKSALKKLLPLNSAFGSFRTIFEYELRQ